jgi:hypothetical protein
MGWKLKALAVVVGLMLITLGLWPLSAILFLYAASGLIPRGLRRGRGGASGSTTPWSGSGAPPTSLQQGAQQPTPTGFRTRFSHPVLRIIGAVFLGLSVVALTQRGAYSPFVFGGIGVVLLLWGMPLPRLGISLRPVEESILLRSLDSIHWFALAEVKLSTRQAGRALGGIDETLLVAFADGGPSIFVVLKTTSLTFRDAEESLLARLQELARVSAPLGAYLLPVDSGKAVGGALRRSFKPVALDPKGWPSSLSTTDYDLLTMEARRGGFVHSVGAYRKGSDGSDVAKITIPHSRQTLSRPSLLWEVFQELGKKVQWPKPDGYTTFLASFYATGGETIGERVSEVASTGNSQEVLVQSLGTPAVQLSRAQLRAIVRMYDTGSR